jgi:hypothetical protein
MDKILAESTLFFFTSSTVGITTLIQMQEISLHTPLPCHAFRFAQSPPRRLYHNVAVRFIAQKYGKINSHLPLQHERENKRLFLFADKFESPNPDFCRGWGKSALSIRSAKRLGQGFDPCPSPKKRCFVFSKLLDPLQITRTPGKSPGNEFFLREDLFNLLTWEFLHFCLEGATVWTWWRAPLYEQIVNQVNYIRNVYHTITVNITYTQWNWRR